MKYYLVIKRNEALILATTWTNLDIIMLVEISHEGYMSDSSV